MSEKLPEVIQIYLCGSIDKPTNRVRDLIKHGCITRGVVFEDPSTRPVTDEGRESVISINTEMMRDSSDIFVICEQSPMHAGTAIEMYIAYSAFHKHTVLITQNDMFTDFSPWVSHCVCKVIRYCSDADLITQLQQYIMEQYGKRIGSQVSDIIA